MNKFGYILILLPLLLLSACRQTVRPQAPANRPVEDDSALQLVLSNLQLTERTGEELARSVHQTGLPFVLHEQGFWALRTAESERPILLENEEVEIALQVSEIELPEITEGHQIENSRQTIHVGKRETITAIDMLLAEARHGEQYTVLVPYFCAYGVAGNGNVAPYANLRVELEIY